MTRDSLDAGPGGEGHDAVVDDVQGGQVAPLLPQQEEQRVEVVNELGEEVPPSNTEHPQSIFII